MFTSFPPPFFLMCILFVFFNWTIVASSLPDLGGNTFSQRQRVAGRSLFEIQVLCFINNSQFFS